MSNKNRFSDSSAKSYSQALYELASEEKNLNDVEKILKNFVMICSKNSGEISAKLIVAKELNENQINKIKNDLSQNFGSDVKLNYNYDPDLIGGLIIQVESVMIDTSIKNKLQKLEEQFKY